MRLRGGLVVAEMALTVLLLVGAGLLGKSFLEITRVDPGFRTEKLIAFDLSLPAYAYPEPLQQRSFFRNLRTELEAVTPVVSAALTRNPPVSGRNMTSPVVIEGRDPGRAPALHVQVATVSPSYFRTMGTKVVEGREFSETDDERGAPVAIVNEALAEAYFPGGPALGMRARTFFGEPAMREIVGVVEDVRHHTPAREPPPTFYVPSGQDVSSAYTVVVRTRGEEAEALSAVTEVVRRADAGLPLANLATLDELLARTVAGPRFYTQSLGAFAFLAVLLAVVGLYGVMSSSVTRRERELGIRFALGADGSDVMGIVLREALAVSAGGVVLGLLGALALTRVLESLLFGVSPNDPFVLAGGAVVALVVSLASAALPAWRASRTDPALALRA